MAAKKARRTDVSSERAESQRQAGMRRSMPVDRLASQRREAAAMAVRTPSTGQRIINLVFGPPPGSSVRLPDGSRAELQYGVPASGVAGIGRMLGESGVRGSVNRAVNRVTGRTVLVHGSPTSGLRTLEPRTPVNAPHMQTAVYGTNPSYVHPSRGGPLRLGELARDYAESHGQVGSGSAYVARVPSRSLTNPRSAGTNPSQSVVTSRAPARVVEEIPIRGRSADELQRLIVESAKRAGARVPRGTR
jgi:hypothetical protein